MSLRDVVFLAAVLVCAVVGFGTALRFDRRCLACHRRFPNAAERLAHERRAHQYR